MRTDIFLIHGITKSINPDTYYTDFVQGIRKYMSINEDVNFHPVDYSGLLAQKEETIYSWMSDMGYLKIRKFACDFVCDVLAYAYPKRKAVAGDFIFDVTQLLKIKFNEVNTMHPKSRKIIIGHSLGSIVGYGATFDMPIDTLITMGSPFAYFSIRYKGFGEMNPTLSKFYNFYINNDIVSTVIARNPNFGGKVLDVQIKSWNPLNLLPIRAHSYYWQSHEVHKKISEIITKK